MESDDFRRRYELYIDDIKYIKTRQWTVTYYILSLIAALIALYGFLKRSNHDLLTDWTIILSFLAIAVAFIGTYFHKGFQEDLRNYRVKLYESIFHLSESFQAYEIRKPTKYLSITKDLEFTVIFVALLWFGAGAEWLILNPRYLCVSLFIALVPPAFFCIYFVCKKDKNGSDEALVLEKAKAIKPKLSGQREAFLKRRD
jgi:hypothetical protein